MNTSNINPTMTQLGKVRSVIRETFEYGNKRAKEIGRENVFDFSLGNPSVPAPEIVDDTICGLIKTGDSVQLHSYTSAQGAEPTRAAIAEDINRRYNAGIDKNDIYMTCGAAASLTVSIHALACEGDEFITFAPFFPEYKVFVNAAGATLTVIPADTENFQIDFDTFVSAISPKTKAVIINTPNNPTGVVLSESTITRLCEILKAKSEEFGAPIYLISDEPYRELVYDNTTVVPYLTNCYDYTLVCYSYSKSLSLPGERIGYIVVCNKMPHHEDVYAAVCGAGRALGFVCAPAMMQKVIVSALGTTSDISVYKTNRDLLYNALTEYGYKCVHPDGAFYLFVKALEDDAAAFCEKAKEYDLLLVPSDSFGCKGYIRIAYCVTTDMIRRSLPAFKKLAETYGK
ncbi:MAG: pyridoxal phosphate-dependent aminotransferase [Bacillota bacterium]|nr:pyridoxal phosphate-dependent aminotransferase [Bacillota bacterium]